VQRASSCASRNGRQAVLGTTVRHQRGRGPMRCNPRWPRGHVTMHPAYLLRLRPPANETAWQLFASDVQLAVRLAAA